MGLKVLKHVEVGKVGLGLIQIVEILPAPAKGFPLGMFNAARIHSALFQDIFVLGCEIFAHDRDHADIGEITGGQGKIGGRAAQHVLHFPRGAGDGIECNRTDCDYAHAFLALRYLSRMSFNR